MRGMFFLLGYLVSERNIDCRFFSCQLSANSVLAGSNAADDIPWLNLCQIILYRLVIITCVQLFEKEAIKSKITLVK
jgi:hypothetical protein